MSNIFTEGTPIYTLYGKIYQEEGDLWGGPRLWCRYQVQKDKRRLRATGYMMDGQER